MNEEPIITTGVHNENFQTKEPSSSKLFKNGIESFNALSPLPALKCLDLGDGRGLFIQEWFPEGNKKIHGGANHLDVTVKGYIKMECCNTLENPTTCTITVPVGLEGFEELEEAFVSLSVDDMWKFLDWAKEVIAKNSGNSTSATVNKAKEEAKKVKERDCSTGPRVIWESGMVSGPHDGDTADCRYCGKKAIWLGGKWFHMEYTVKGDKFVTVPIANAIQNEPVQNRRTDNLIESAREALGLTEADVRRIGDMVRIELARYEGSMK